MYAVTLMAFEETTKSIFMSSREEREGRVSMMIIDESREAKEEVCG